MHKPNGFLAQGEFYFHICHYGYNIHNGNREMAKSGYMGVAMWWAGNGYASLPRWALLAWLGLMALATLRLHAQQARPNKDSSLNLGASLPKPNSEGPTLNELSRRLWTTADGLEELLATLNELLQEADLSLANSETSLESCATSIRQAWQAKDAVIKSLEARIVRVEAERDAWRALGAIGLGIGLAGLIGGLIIAADG